MLARDRLSYVQREVLALLRTQPAISYTDISAELEIDRSSALIAIRQLERKQRIVKRLGRGRLPNFYEVHE